MGVRVKSGIVEHVSPNGKLLAVYNHSSLGAKGRLYGENSLPDTDYWEARIPVMEFRGRKYHVVQYCDDFAELNREYYKTINDRYSAYYCA